MSILILHYLAIAEYCPAKIRASISRMTKKILAAFAIVISFISAIPFPQRFIPAWNDEALRFFCPVLAIAGVIFGGLWLIFWKALALAHGLSVMLRGFMMMVMTLALTGGLHMDGLMDTCDAVFSRRDRETRLKILSDTHAGSFAVIGCVIVLLGKTLLFAEMLSRGDRVFLVPVYSRLGMAFLMNTLPFAKDVGLAVMLGGFRRKSDNAFFVAMMILLWPLSTEFLVIIFVVCVMLWWRMCMRIFGGITGDLLGAFVEVSEAVMMMGMVIEGCM